MGLDLNKVASVLDAIAVHLDAEEGHKTASAKAARAAVVDKVAERYAQATGDELPSAIRSKLADTDKDVVALLTDMVEKQAGNVEPLGSASVRDDGERVPTTKKEAAEAADDRFLSWLTS